MDDVIFLPADKGNCTVVLDRSSYESKLQCLIQDGPYRMVKRDPGQRFRKRLSELLKPLLSDGVLDRSTFLYWCPTHFVSPHIYGLPKIHKDNCPLRPIVSMRGSLFAPLGGHLATVLAPYYKEAASYVENSLHVKKRVSEAMESHPLAAFGSFDVVSLFTRVPVREAIEVVGRLLSQDSDLASRTKINAKILCDLIEFCLTSCYFIFGSSFYVQEDGVAMGSNLGCVIANIYMRFFEEMALSTALSRHLPVPLLWVRYVDDVLVLLPCKDDFDALLSFLNSLRNSICFTLELESDGHLPFLDMVIQRSEGGVVFDVYRKPTHTDKYLNRDSCHPPQVFKGLVTGLKKRAVTICSSSKVSSELRHLRDALAGNAYSQKDLSQLHSRRITSRPRSVVNKRAVVPFIPGLSHRVSRCFRKAGLEVSFKPPPTLRSFLCKKKPKQIEGLGLV